MYDIILIGLDYINGPCYWALVYVQLLGCAEIMGLVIGPCYWAYLLALLLNTPPYLITALYYIGYITFIH